MSATLSCQLNALTNTNFNTFSRAILTLLLLSTHTKEQRPVYHNHEQITAIAILLSHWTRYRVPPLRKGEEISLFDLS
jgi:hypothetical protein